MYLNKLYNFASFLVSKRIRAPQLTANHALNCQPVSGSCGTRPGKVQRWLWNVRNLSNAVGTRNNSSTPYYSIEKSFLVRCLPQLDLPLDWNWFPFGCALPDHSELYSDPAHTPRSFKPWDNFNVVYSRCSSAKLGLLEYFDWWSSQISTGSCV